MKKCPKLRELYIYRCGEQVVFTGQYIFDLNRLKTLAIKQCNALSVTALEKKLSNLRDLTHLDFCSFLINLDGCEYLNDNCFKDLGHLAYIEYLNLEGTIVSTAVPQRIQ